MGAGDGHTEAVAPRHLLEPSVIWAARLQSAAAVLSGHLTRMRPGTASTVSYCRDCGVRLEGAGIVGHGAWTA